MLKVTLRQLNVFIEIAKHGNVSAAATKICISQAAASMSLAQLENHLGTALFYREKKSLRLSEAGKKLLPKAYDIIELTHEFESSEQLSKDKLQGQLRIGASTTIANYILPDKLNNFLIDYPSIKASLTTSNSEAIIQKLKNFEIDIALLEGLYQDPDIDMSAFSQDELVIFCHPKHKLALKRTINLEDLTNFPWVLREADSGTRKVFDSALQNWGIVLKEKIDIINSSEAIKNWVQHNPNVLSCLSKTLLQMELEYNTLKILHVDNNNIKRHFYFATRKDFNLKKHQTAFKNYMLNVDTALN